MFAFLRGIYLRRKLGPPVIVVSGLPRSGTSMMMKMLAAAGLTLVTDEIRTADEDNPRGYFEYERVKELDKGGDKSWVKEHQGKVIKVISFLLENLPDDCSYKVIFMRRDFQEVLASQNKMLVRRGESGGDTEDERMAELYRKHLGKIDVLIRQRPNIDRLDVNYREVLDNPDEHAQRVTRFLGMKLDSRSMSAAVDQALYRNRQP